MSGLDAPVSPCLQFRLRSFPPSLPSPSVSSSLPAPTCSASTSCSDCPPPARLTRGKVRATVHYSQDSARAGKTVIHRISVRASGSCRGLRPCPLCHLCPATATAIAVAASGPKQHRPSEERPLQPRCEVQRHHPHEWSCRGCINLSLGRSRQRYQECIPKLMIKKIRNFHRYLLIITCLYQIILLNSHILSEMLKD